MCELPRFFAASRRSQENACRVCGIVLTSKANVKNHEALHSPRNGNFTCSVCFGRLATARGRNYHERAVHDYKRSGASRLSPHIVYFTLASVRKDGALLENATLLVFLVEQARFVYCLEL